MSAPLYSDANINISKSVLAKEEDGLLKLIGKSSGLHQLQGSSIHLNQSISPLAVGNSSCCLLPTKSLDTLNRFLSFLTHDTQLTTVIALNFSSAICVYVYNQHVEFTREISVLVVITWQEHQRYSYHPISKNGIIDYNFGIGLSVVGIREAFIRKKRKKFGFFIVLWDHPKWKVKNSIFLPQKRLNFNLFLDTL